MSPTLHDPLPALIAVETFVDNECSMFTIGRVYEDLIVAYVDVHELVEFMTCLASTS